MKIEENQKVINKAPEWVKGMLEEAGKRGLFYSEDDITCKKCARATSCLHAWDLYNTNGDCLDMK